MEELPTMTHAGDVTNFLEKGDWRSYNIAFFPDIYEEAGVPARVAQYGPVASYDLAPRAKIFRRDVNTITDLSSLKYFMRYNDFQNDPFSEGNPHYAIASRQDLDSTSPIAEGAIDTKITTSQLYSSLTTIAIAGPTTQNQPVFAWSGQWASQSHVGLPYSYNFPWVTLKPSLF